jgi:hypothetical protein
MGVDLAKKAMEAIAIDTYLQFGHGASSGEKGDCLEARGAPDNVGAESGGDSVLRLQTVLKQFFCHFVRFAAAYQFNLEARTVTTVKSMVVLDGFAICDVSNAI